MLLKAKIDAVEPKIEEACETENYDLAEDENDAFLQPRYVWLLGHIIRLHSDVSKKLSPIKMHL